jgi:DNA-binding LytR/AlgR family response regulator
MEINFLLKNNQGFEAVYTTPSLETALERLPTLKANTISFDIDTAQYLIQHLLHKKNPPRTHITARSHQGLQKILLSEILHFQADHKYVTVHYLNGTLLILDTLKDLEFEFLNDFVRIHRNNLVNIHFIESLVKDPHGYYWIKLLGVDTPFSVSRRQISNVRKRMK